MGIRQYDNLTNNVVSFELYTNKKNKPKLKKDGGIKQTPNNQVEDRWVHPIRNREDILKCIKCLSSDVDNATTPTKKLAASRNLLLFVVGINIGLRVSDLVQLKWNVFFERDMKTFKNIYGKKEKKTGKIKQICINDMIKKYIKKYLDDTGIMPEENDYIFTSSKQDEYGRYKNICDTTVTNMIKKCTKDAGLNPDDFGTHSLRKTYAYQKYMLMVENNDPMALVKVQKDLNHRNSSDTARYLGITREESIKSSMDLGNYLECSITEERK